MADSLPRKFNDLFGLTGRLEPSSHVASDAPVVDTQELLERCMGNIEFAERMLAKFLQRFDDDMIQLEKGIEKEDAEEIRRIAHRLKGTAANVSACRLRRILDDIEQLGRKQRLTEIPSRLEELHLEWSRFQTQVTL